MKSTEKSSEYLNDFKLVKEKCIKCGKCIDTCPGALFSFDEKHEISMKKVSEFGWDGCWQCQHCLAVCPEGAISILGKAPQDSLPPVSPEKAAPLLDRLMTNRRSCRRYLDQNVHKGCIDEMLRILQTAPTGGNKKTVEYTLIDDKDEMAYFRKLAYVRMDELARQGIYARTFDAKSYGQMKEWEKTVRPDMLFCGAPHLLIPHAPIGRGCWVQDVNIACTYFELLCASRGLGSVFMIYPISVLENMPDIKRLLKIPENHYIGMMVGFGYPEITYARGIRRDEPERIHRLTFRRDGTDF